MTFRSSSEVHADIMSAMRAIAVWNGFVDRPSKKKREAELQRMHNQSKRLRLIFGLVEVRYLLIPFAVRLDTDSFLSGNTLTVVTSRQFYVFGIRVARWVIGSEAKRLSYDPGNVPMKRYRRRKGGFRTWTG